MLLFKYLSPEGASHVLQRGGDVQLRFAFPGDYNDPYELFLETDRRLRSQSHRAFYKFFLGNLKQFPVTCFSKRPDSITMWAHYAREGSGVCIAFDEDELTDQFPVAFVGDVTYHDGPAQINAALVAHAYETGKGRHTQWLLNDAYGLAYFAKRSDWQYELERRMIVERDALRQYNRRLFARIPGRAVRYIIVGLNAPRALRHLGMRRAEHLRASFLELRIGKRYYRPFFAEGSDDVYLCNRSSFQKVRSVCAQCGEPARLNSAGLCASCRIEDAELARASVQSLLGAALQLGVVKLVEVGFSGVERKGSSTKKPRKARKD